MCTTVGFVASVPDGPRLAALIEQWTHERERSIYLYPCEPQSLRVFTEGLAEEGRTSISFEIGAVGSGCSCGLISECEGPNGEPPCDPVVARADVCSLIDLICSVPFSWLRFGFTDRYYSLTVDVVTPEAIKAVVTSGEFPDDKVFHVEGQ